MKKTAIKKRITNKLIHFFIKFLFKITFRKIKNIGIKTAKGNVNYLFLFFKMSKVFYANFFNALKSLFLKSAVYPQAYHLSNFAFAKVFHGEKDVNSTIFPHAAFPSAGNDSKGVSSSYLVRGFQEYFFSNYFKINNYVLIKYFLTVSKILDSGSNNLLFFSAKAASSAAKKKPKGY